MNGLQGKMLAFVGGMVWIICIFFGIGSYLNGQFVLSTQNNTSIEEVAIQSANTVEGLIAANLKELEAVAAREGIWDDVNFTKEQKIQILHDEAERIGCQRMTIIDSNGDSFNGNGKEQNLGDRGYFTKAFAGESNVTDPTIGKSTGDLLVFFATPIKKNGNITGVLQQVTDGNKLAELTNSVEYGESGFAYLISANGTVIAHPNNEIVMESFNVIDAASEDSAYEEYAQMVKLALDTKRGHSMYSLNGETHIVGFAPVDGTDWELVVEQDKKEFDSNLSVLKTTGFISAIFFIVIGNIITFFIAKRLSKSIKVSAQALEVFAGGDFRQQEEAKEYLQRKDEVGDITRAMHSMSEALSKTLNEIKNTATEIDDQSDSLSTTSNEISLASQNVARTIGEVARGTVSQSEDLVLITQILEEFGNMVRQILEEVADVNDASNNINDKAELSSKEMEKLNSSVKKVEDVFVSFRTKIDELGANITNINEFTNVINQIASQTNLLALNASIEAARAGEAGKGFAVVAEEIKALAEQTQQSSQHISELVVGISDEANNIIETSSVMNDELSQQGEVIKKSIESFNEIIDAIGEVIPKIDTVQHSVDELDEKKDNIVTSIDNITAISTKVSESSEEISAAAEEMSASISEMTEIAVVLKNRAGEMRDEVNGFIVENEA